MTLFRRVIFTPFAESQLYSANTCTLGNLSRTSQIPKLPLRFAPRNEAPECVTPNWAKVATCQLSLGIAAICTDRSNFLLPTSRYCQHMDLPKTVTMPSFPIFYSVVLHPKKLAKLRLVTLIVAPCTTSWSLHTGLFMGEPSKIISNFGTSPTRALQYLPTPLTLLMLFPIEGISTHFAAVYDVNSVLSSVAEMCKFWMVCR